MLIRFRLPAEAAPMISSNPLRRSRRTALACLTLALATGFVTGARAIEMFTFFGDGSRIGLPSLEVPVEAYPGIPLRSDRLRARRRAARLGPNAAVRSASAGHPRGLAVTTLPPAPDAIAAPAPATSPERVQPAVLPDVISAP